MSEFMKFEDINYSEDKEFFYKLTEKCDSGVCSLLYNKIYNKQYITDNQYTVKCIEYANILEYIKILHDLGYSNLFTINSDAISTKLRTIALSLNNDEINSVCILSYDHDYYNLFICINLNTIEITKHLNPIFEYSNYINLNDDKLTKFYQISQTPFGFEKIQLNLNKISFNKNHYNNLDLNKLVETINSDKPGVIVFNGVPGSGKTSLIKHLTSIIDKEFVNISGDMLEIFNSPQFQRFIVSELKDSVIILEDCEKLIKSRNISNSNISTLLNLGDGLLGSALNIKIILTYNTKDTNVDSALLRKGRTLFKHEFTTLSAEKATEISKEIGKNVVYDTDVVLTEVFNAEAQDFSETTERKKIGF